jgi:alkylation response protein AidB-like acyl-CoA dehydrogenase
MAVLTDEQEELATAVRELAADHCAEQRVRDTAASPSGRDDSLWEQLIGLGMVRLAVPEDIGGQGGGVADLAVALEGLGAALACVPLLSSSIALAVLERATAVGAAESAAPLLARQASGESRGTVAAAEREAGWNPANPATRAVLDASGGARVNGTKVHVLDAVGADDHLVLASDDTSGAHVLVAVGSAAPGITVAGVDGLDPTRRISSLTLNDASGTVVATGEHAGAAVGHGLDVVAVLLAAEQVGVPSRCLDAAVGYAKVREQFGVPVGTFQAIKHKCADMLVRVESARSLIRSAAVALDAGSSDAGTLASAARAYCSEVAVSCAADNIEIHGGIGFTWEHAAHLYLRRAKSAEAMFGSPAGHRERVVALTERDLGLERI